MDLSISQAILIALAPIFIVVLIAFLAERFEIHIHHSLCVLMVLCIVFAVAMV